MNPSSSAKAVYSLTISRAVGLKSPTLRTLLSVSLLFAAFGASGCVPRMVVNKRMALVAGNQIAALATDKARLVFIRPGKAGYNVASSLFDITSGDPEFIGIASYGARLAYDVEPGAHRFMVIGENADFMDADLAAGKTYFAIVKVRMGMWKARFGLGAISADMLAENPYREWVHEGEWIENTDNSVQWARQAAPSIRTRMDRYLAKWETKPDKPTLHPEDGI